MGLFDFDYSKFIPLRLTFRSEPLVTPKPAPPPIPGAHLDFAYACEQCGAINDGVTKGCCKNCGSRSVFFIKELLDKQHNRAKQRLEMVKRMKAAGYGNDTTTLTDFQQEPPKPAA